jgi:hypothetical protein
MNSTNPGETPSAAPGTAPTTPSATPSATANALTIEQLNETLKPILARLDGLSGAVAKVSRKAEEPKTDPLIPPKPEGKDAQVELLLQKHSQSLKSAAFAKAINAVGVSGDDADLLQSAVEGKYGQRLKVNVETDEVYFEADDGSKRGVGDVVGEFFKKHGDRFAPAKRGPNGDGLKGDSRAPGAAHPFTALDYHQIMSHPNAQLRAEYQTQYADEFQRKRREAPAKKR